MSKYIDADKLIHDLEERIFAYSEGYAEGDDNRKDAIETLLKDVKYQYSLQQEQPEKPAPADLEDAADEMAIRAFPEKKSYSTVIDRVVDYNAVDRKNYRDGIIAGAKWQADHTPLPEDTVLFNNGVAEGKRLMMKEAEECELYWDGDFLAIDLNMAALGYSERDKVRVIIVKE